MSTRALLAFLFVVCAVSGGLQAYSTQGVNSLLTQYGVPNSISSGLTAVNLTYSGDSYVALYRGGALYFVVNVTGANAYSFVLNSTAIYGVIQGHTTGLALQQANFTVLSAQMRKYQGSSSQAIGDCLLETGLWSGSTCNATNDCVSCQQVPVCKKALDGTGGATGVLGTGIMTFESQYGTLNQSFNAFYSADAGVNASNAQARLSQLNSAFGTISNITQTMYQNPVFPPTQNVTSAQTSICINYLSDMSAAPWYCTALGFCESLNYNYTKLGYMQGLLNQINALPISGAQIRQVAANASSTENLYVGSVIDAQQKARLALLLNATLPGYGTLVNNTSALLTHVTNSSLSFDLAALKASYANVTAHYATANLIAANRTLSAQYSALRTLYARINATYSVLPGRVRNNTAKLIELQLDGAVSPAIGSLAFEEFALNNALFSGSLGGFAALGTEANTISQKLTSYSTGSIGLVELARSVDGPFIVAVASAIGLSYPAAVALAPALGALLSLMIGAVVFALVLLFRARMHAQHRVVLNSKTKKNWNIVLGCLLALILLYVLATYALLASASSSAPFAAFSGALGSTKQLVIAVNGTPTSGEQACAAAIKASLPKGETATLAAFSNGLCTAGSVTGDVNTCMGDFARTGVPVVLLTENSTAGMSFYSLYGTVLRISGPESVMDSCYAQYMVR